MLSRVSVLHSFLFYHMDLTHLFIHSSVDGHLYCFYFLAIMNNAAFVYKVVSGHVFFYTQVDTWKYNCWFITVILCSKF